VRRPRAIVPLASLSLAALLAGASACFTFVSFDLEDGGGGSGAANTGGEGAGVSTSTGVGGVGAGGADGGGGVGAGGGDPCGCDASSFNCDADACGARAWPCGAGSECCGGVCSPVGAGSDPVAEIALRGEHVVVRSSSRLLLWPSGPGPGLTPVDELDIDDPNGTLLGTPDHLYYRPQDCGLTLANVCLTDVDTSDSALSCHQRLKLSSMTLAEHINGAALVGNDLYYAPSLTRQIMRVDVSGFPGGGAGCAGARADGPVPQALVSQMNPPSFAAFVQNPSLLEHDPIGRDVWWSTFGENGCVYQADLADCATTPCIVDCAFEDDDVDPGHLTASGAGVFLATSATTNQVDGPVLRIPRASPQEAAFIGETAARWPIDSDESYLFASLPAGGGQRAAVVALLFNDANPGGFEVGRAYADLGALTITALDASDPDYVYFGTAFGLYRWRKPPCPEGDAGTCGDGCVWADEQCDDGNLEGDDGCSALCTLEAQ
jgi:cysteine-rich repeat protein